MYFSKKHISQALAKLGTLHPFFGTCFLAFKLDQLPVDDVIELNLTYSFENLLFQFYKPIAASRHWFIPFRGSNNNCWKSARYASTSLQRIAADTFSDCLTHKKGSQLWGWKSGYERNLKSHLGDRAFPVRELCCWLYRDVNWPDNVSWLAVEAYFVQTFNITADEWDYLFPRDDSPEPIDGMATEPVTLDEIIEMIGEPPDATSEDGGTLKSLTLRGIGPSKQLHYEPADRLNIITGDNSLGKTFLIECAWFALTGLWITYPAYPLNHHSQSEPSISFTTASRNNSLSRLLKFDRHSQEWQYPPEKRVRPGLIVYARYDGSFAIWDPAVSDQGDDLATSPLTVLSREEVWDGSRDQVPGGRLVTRCNGLLADWTSWQQFGTGDSSTLEMLVTALKHLSPSSEEPLELGLPRRYPWDKRFLPTLRMRFGEVPILLCSAGIKRISALAYMITWAWYEHLQNSITRRSQPSRQMVLLVDEVEAHLHPRWQRMIVPALISVIEQLGPFVSPQLHVATHSPLVLASVEPLFEEKTDRLHTLELEDGVVSLQHVDFVKRGRADKWLMSEMFDLTFPRSIPAEGAIREALHLQASAVVSPIDVARVNGQLERYLAPDDDFWPRWRFFAEENGVDD